MGFGNVIPIDTEAARRLARRHMRFRWLVAALVSAWVALLVPTLLFTPLPPLGTFAALAVLVVLAEHRFVLFGDETSMSASIIVIVASVFIFSDTSPLAGPMLIGSLGGLYLPHLRHGNRLKIAFNGSAIGVAAWASSAAALVVGRPESSALGTLITTLAAVLTYWVVDNLLVASYQAVGGCSYFRAARILTSSDTDILAWAAAACVGATALQGRSAVALAFIAFVVAGRVVSLTRLLTPVRCRPNLGAPADSLVVWIAATGIAISVGTASPSLIALGISVAWFLPRHPADSCRLVAVGLPIVALSTLGSGPVGTVAVLVATLAVLLLTLSKPGSWTACISTGAAVFALTDCLAFRGAESSSPMLLVTAVVLPPAIATTLYAIRSRLTAERVDALTALGIAAPSSAEIAALGAAIAAAHLAQSLTAVVLLAGTLTLAVRVATRPTAQRSSAIASH